MNKILFVCMGNICRSPAAHCCLQDIVTKAGLQDAFEIDSAGTIGMHAGEAPDYRMQQTLQKHNIPVIGRSRKLIEEDLEYYDLILVMDHENLACAQALASSERHKQKIQLFCDYCEKHEEIEVPDPYYGGPDGFEHVMDLIIDGCQNILNPLRAR